MQNAKIVEGLVEPEHWLDVAAVTVAGDPEAAPLTPGLVQEENEAIIQSWSKIAVFQVRRELGSGWVYDLIFR